MMMITMGTKHAGPVRYKCLCGMNVVVICMNGLFVGISSLAIVASRSTLKLIKYTSIGTFVYIIQDLAGVQTGLKIELVNLLMPCSVFVQSN